MFPAEFFGPDCPIRDAAGNFYGATVSGATLAMDAPPT